MNYGTRRVLNSNLIKIPKKLEKTKNDKNIKGIFSQTISTFAHSKAIMTMIVIKNICDICGFCVK